MKNTSPCYCKTGALPKAPWTRTAIARALRNLRKHAIVFCKKEAGFRIYFARESWAVRTYFVPTL